MDLLRLGAHWGEVGGCLLACPVTWCVAELMPLQAPICHCRGGPLRLGRPTPPPDTSCCPGQSPCCQLALHPPGQRKEVVLLRPQRAGLAVHRALLVCRRQHRRGGGGAES